jgi:hypothetical protein
MGLDGPEAGDINPSSLHGVPAVVLLSPCVEMVRVDAPLHIAVVKHVEAGRDRPASDLVAEPMGSAAAELTIAVRVVQGALPEPTSRRFLDVPPEAF